MAKPTSNRCTRRELSPQTWTYGPLSPPAGAVRRPRSWPSDTWAWHSAWCGHPLHLVGVTSVIQPSSQCQHAQQLWQRRLVLDPSKTTSKTSPPHLGQASSPSSILMSANARPPLVLWTSDIHSQPGPVFDAWPSGRHQGCPSPSNRRGPRNPGAPPPSLDREHEASI